MVKKVTKKKATARKVSASKPAAKKAAPGKTTPQKAAPKKAARKVAKKPVAKVSTKAMPKKPAAKTLSKGQVKKAASKKAVTKKAPAKAAPKKVTIKKAPAKKPATKSTTQKKVAPKKASSTKPGGKSSASKAAASKPAATPADNKSGRKGITIVTSQKLRRKRVVAKKPPALVPPLSGSILGMGISGGKPLIQSGPKAPPIVSEQSGGLDGSGKKPKSPFTKRQLEKYHEILIQKRHELLGDIDSMETEALKSESGALSHLPQHMAEQGSEAYEQTLSLDLAQADRKLLIEIDAALDRIGAKTYGLCEHSGKPISKERLNELPWARYSIEAARELERRAT